MARKPLGDTPMSGAERARRHREKRRAAAKQTLFDELISEIERLSKELRELKFGGKGAPGAEILLLEAERDNSDRIKRYRAEFEAVDDFAATKAARARAALDSISALNGKKKASKSR